MPLTKNRIRAIRSLTLRKGRDELGLFLAEGLRLVGDAASSGAEIAEAFATEEFERSAAGGELCGRLRSRGAACRRVSARELSAIADTVHAQGIVALVRIPRPDAAEIFRRAQAPAVAVALDGVADPGNLGSIVRTCDWFGAAGLLVGRGSVDLYNPKVVRATMGGLFHIPCVQEISLSGALSAARRMGFAVVVADAREGTPEEETEFTPRSLIVLGSEARGVDPALAALADLHVAIRRRGGGESLNVGVACGIILAACRRRQEKSAEGR
ncbi:MAG TPA: RNA methyltransferase [Bacteroidota bacterium]|nr:RNA methyltransferase [Bacteroidota bacterium]